MADVTRILSAIEQGDPQADEQLLPLVYNELRRLAASKLAHEKPGQTLQATALVHEAYLRLTGGKGNEKSWDSRGHFFAAAAEAMRRILVERARRRRRLKHGHDVRRVDLHTGIAEVAGPTEDVLAINDALTKLEREAPAKANLVKLRFFAGMTTPEAACVMGISVATAERYWTYARCWLLAELSQDDAFDCS